MGFAHFSSRGELGMNPDAVEYIYLNVGANTPSSADTTDYIYLNVGMNTPPSQDGTEYVYIDVLARQRFVGWGTPL